jgi:hypothetical protein
MLTTASPISAEAAARMAETADEAPVPTAEGEPVVRSPEEEGWQKKDDGWHKGGYRIFAQEDGVCQIWTGEGLIAKAPDISDALVFVDQDLDESDQEQTPATPAAVETQDSDPNEEASKRLTERCAQYHITRRRGKTNGKPWRLMRRTEVINDFKTEEAAVAAKDKCIRDLEAIIKLDPNDFDNQWVDVKGDGSSYTNRLYKLHGISGQAGGKYNAFFDGSIGLAPTGGTSGGATCKNLEEAKAACKKHYIEKVLPIGDENARFLKNAVDAKGMRFTSPHFIHFDIEKIGYLGHRNVLTFTSERQDLIEMLLEGASAEVLDRLRRKLGVEKEAEPMKTGHTLANKRDRGEKTEATSPRKANRKARNEAR